MPRKIQLSMDIVFPITAPSWIDIDNISRNNIFVLPNHGIHSDFRLHVICLDLCKSNVTSTACVFLYSVHSRTILRTALKNLWNRKMKNIHLQSKLTMIRMLGMVLLSIQTVAGNGEKEVWSLYLIFVRSSLIQNIYIYIYKYIKYIILS